MNSGSISGIVIVLQGESQLSVGKLSPQTTTLWFVASSHVLNFADGRNIINIHEMF